MKFKIILIVFLLFLYGFSGLCESKKRVMKPYTSVKGLEKTDFSKSSINLKNLYAGCPKKDCIPALKNPKFIKITESKLSGKSLGIVVTYKNKTKFYPFNILVWHEIINDTIEDLKLAVTFCPLCGTGMVFNRKVNGKILNFGVSGTLYQSNLTMYDDQTESLWSQTLGKCIVGKMMGKKLNLVSMQQLTINETLKKYKSAKVVSTETGHNRDYTKYPYGDYETSSKIFFPVSEFSNKFPIKELFYIFHFNQKSIAIRINGFKDGKYEKKIDKSIISLKKSNGIITITNSGKLIPGYYEMWFSWSANHQTDGIVWEKEARSK